MQKNLTSLGTLTVQMVYARHWGMTLFTFFKGKLAGQDDQGNKYYQERFLFGKPQRKPRRWVVYHGIMEGSQVPAEWFGWLHHYLDVPLDSSLKKFWQKSHRPNLTGTPFAYRPTDRTSKDRAFQPASKGYEPWQPS